MEPVVILYSFDCFLTIPIRDCDGVDVACVFAGSSQRHRQPLVCLSEPFRRGGETPGTGFEKPTAGSLLFGIFVNTILIATSLLTFHLLDAVEFQSLRRKKAVWHAATCVRFTCGACVHTVHRITLTRMTLLFATFIASLNCFSLL